jgi:hypothetical protein
MVQNTLIVLSSIKKNFSASIGYLSSLFFGVSDGLGLSDHRRHLYNVSVLSDVSPLDILNLLVSDSPKLHHSYKLILLRQECTWVSPLACPFIPVPVITLRPFGDHITLYPGIHQIPKMLLA